MKSVITNCVILVILIIARIICHFLRPIRKKVVCALLKQMCEHLGLPDHDVRYTLLRVNATKKKLKQVERYSVAGGEKSKTTIEIGRGVGGRAWNMNEPCLEVIEDDFEKHMMGLGFPENQARQFKSRESYICVPIPSKTDESHNPTIGVICIDSNSIDTFAREDIVETINLYISTFGELLKERIG